MKSPFPGMDPFIEACGAWEGFHNHLVEAIYRSLAARLPPGYVADTAVRSYVVLVEQEGKQEKLAKPDVGITEPRSRRAGGGVAVAEPATDTESVVMQAFVAERFEESFVEIYAQDEERSLVTCVEVLSPANKRHDAAGWQEYQRKRQALLLGRASLVEIDLLRGGHKMPMLGEWPEGAYRLLVHRQSSGAGHCRVWPVPLQRRLPPIPVPLREPDPDLTLDLQPLLEDIYVLGRYAERLDYSRKLTPALTPAEARWVRETLKSRPQPRTRK